MRPRCMRNSAMPERPSSCTAGRWPPIRAVAMPPTNSGSCSPRLASRRKRAVSSSRPSRSAGTMPRPSIILACSTPIPAASDLNKLGLMLAKAGQSEEARRLFEQAISIRRDDATAINNLGVLYTNTGRTNDAVAAFRYGIQVAPDEDILYLNLSRMWLRMGEREKARGVMRELLDRKPENAVALRALKELEVQ